VCSPTSTHRCSHRLDSPASPHHRRGPPTERACLRSALENLARPHHPRASPCARTTRRSVSPEFRSKPGPRTAPIGRGDGQRARGDKLGREDEPGQGARGAATHSSQGGAVECGKGAGVWCRADGAASASPRSFRSSELTPLSSPPSPPSSPLRLWLALPPAATCRPTSPSAPRLSFPRLPSRTGPSLLLPRRPRLVAAQPADSRPSLHSPIPQWFRLKSDTKIQYNGACLSPSRRDARATRRSRRSLSSSPTPLLPPRNPL